MSLAWVSTNELSDLAILSLSNVMESFSTFSSGGGRDYRFLGCLMSDALKSLSVQNVNGLVGLERTFGQAEEVTSQIDRYMVLIR